MVQLSVSSLEDYPDLLCDYLHLKDVALRKKMEPDAGLYIAESTQVISRALAAGHQPRSLLLAKRWLPAIEELLETLEVTGYRPDGGPIPVLVAEEETVQNITGFHVHRGAIAAMHRPALPSVKDLLTSLDAQRQAGQPGQLDQPGQSGQRRILILENLVDHTNVGAAFRSAAGIGFDAVLVTPGCADPLYRRSVRVSMGTVFQVPWTRLELWPNTAALKEAGYQLAALALDNNAIDLDVFAKTIAADPSSKVALIAGTEGDGLSARVVAKADHVVRIPMRGDVDSLNVAAACAVACWATRAVG
ncbi:MAG: RNA methyltransferase [Actinomycetaceae bacterium]|nr:RNA methyltransferase [Actinomycetaceae bacterium]